MSFNYEQSIWGKGEASFSWGSPTAVRLRRALAAIKSLGAGAKALEIGCGAGQFIRAIKKLRPNLHCLGCDISVAAIELAKSAHDGVEYSLNDEKTLPFADETLDAVLIFDVLEHVSDPEALILEIRRVLKPCAIFHLYVPCEGDWSSVWHWLDKVGLKKNLTKKYAGHIQYFSRQQVFSLLAKNNFNLARVSYSEHLIGQAVNTASFTMMNRAAKKQGLKQINNEKYFEEVKKSGIMRAIGRLSNVMVNLESVLFKRLPSPSVHVTAIKN